MFDPAAVFRNVVPIRRARRVGFPSSSAPLSEGSDPSQSAMYSINGTERPATSGGVREF